MRGSHTSLDTIGMGVDYILIKTITTPELPIFVFIFQSVNLFLLNAKLWRKNMNRLLVDDFGGLHQCLG